MHFKQLHYDAELFTCVSLCVTACATDLPVSSWLTTILTLPQHCPHCCLSAVRSESIVSVSSSTLSSLLSSPVWCLMSEGQLLPTLCPVIHWAAPSCLWLPSGHLSGFRCSQSAASLQIIIRLRPAVWHASTGSLLLIDSDPMLEVTKNERCSPVSRVISGSEKKGLTRRGRLVALVDVRDFNFFLTLLFLPGFILGPVSKIDFFFYVCVSSRDQNICLLFPFFHICFIHQQLAK